MEKDEGEGTDKPKSSRRKTKVTTRRWKASDIPAVIECQRAAYPNFADENLCDERSYTMQLAAFPEGQVLAEIDGRVVGYATSLIIQMNDDLPWYSYPEVTGVATFSTHDPSGDTLYGADIAVHPDYRGHGIAGRLYDERRKILKRFNLRSLVAGGRIPGYKDHAGRMTPEEYIERVKSGELKDMALSAHLKAGFEVRGVHMDYLTDEASLNYATFIEMPNPDFNAARRKIASSPITRPARKIRVCLAQFEMRAIRTWEDFMQHADFFINTADGYHCHFLLFPEFFTAQLFSIMDPELDSVTAARELAGYTDRFREFIRRRAMSSGLHIIAGSHPVMTDGRLLNVSWLVTPSGNIYSQDKLHVTPGERIHFGIDPGSGIYVFDTGLARIAIQICYDIEFPEVARLMTLAGAEVIFVPFSTDERRSYLRVRYCAQARAVENMIYVALTGNIGTMPEVSSFLLNYGQAAVCTPSDFAYPPRATAGEADPNAETVVIADLDLSDLAMQREMGSVRQLRDRRPDLYRLEAMEKVRLIRTQ